MTILRDTKLLKGVLAAILLAAILAFPSAYPSAAGGNDAAFAEGLRAYDAGDYGEAVNRWRPLAESGDAEAATALAGLYFQGLGVPRDAAEAARWYRRAAERGDGVAQMNLGDMLATGRGVKRDRVRAYFWLELAARQGKAWAARRRDELANTMTASARARALKLIETRLHR